MANYTVKWEIDVEADCAKQAAKEAWLIMKEDEANAATYLDVYEGDFYIETVDMEED